MPSMANMTVYDFGGAVVTYVAMNPAGGDGVKALWRQQALTTSPIGQPWLTCWSRDNGPKTARRVDFEFRYPETYTNTTTGLVSVANQFVLTGSAIVPKGAPNTVGREFALQGPGLLTQSLMKAVFTDGFAPN